MKRVATHSLFSLLVVAVPCGFARQQAEPRHLVDAKDLVKKVDLSRTSYVHGAGNVVWSGTPESHCDCSGFIDLLLMHSYGYDRDSLKKWFASPRPTATLYHDAIVQQRGFTEIKRINDVRPGDILAVKYLVKKDNTGHVMLVAETPRQISPKAPLLAGSVQWEVTVIDSSSSGHGLTDTRHAKGKDGKDHDGLGEGILRIYADKDGKVLTYSWSTLAASKARDPAEESLVMGRLKANYKP